MAISEKSHELLEKLQGIEIKTEAKIKLELEPEYIVIVREASGFWSFDYTDESGKRVEEPSLTDEDVYRIRDVLNWFLETFEDEDA